MKRLSILRTSVKPMHFASAASGGLNSDKCGVLFYHFEEENGSSVMYFSCGVGVTFLHGAGQIRREES